MYRAADIPPRYRRFFFPNAGGPLQAAVSREKVDRQWQLVTLGCGHTVLTAKAQQAGRVRCGFCGGLEPLPEE